MVGEGNGCGGGGMGVMVKGMELVCWNVVVLRIPCCVCFGVVGGDACWCCVLHRALIPLLLNGAVLLRATAARVANDRRWLWTVARLGANIIANDYLNWKKRLRFIMAAKFSDEQD